jgi:hypothetical protein
MTSKYHEITVAIECDDAEGQQAARDWLLRWLSTFGHTAAGHGFAFVEPATPKPKLSSRGLQLPPGARDVTAEHVGTVMGIVGAPQGRGGQRRLPK